MTQWDRGDGPEVRQSGYIPFDDLDHPRRFVDFLERTGIQVFYTHAKSLATGRLLFPAKTGPSHPFLGNRDLFGEVLQLCHERGIICCAMMQICPDKAAALAHPGWAQRDARDAAAPRHYLCFNNPERADYFISQVAEVVARYETDGILFDEFQYHPAQAGLTCYCRHCRKQFRGDYGVEPPEGVPDFNDKFWRDFADWRCRALSGYFRRLRDTIKKIKKDMPVSTIFYPNNFGPQWERGQRGSEMAPLLDLIVHDQSPTSALKESEYYKYYRSLVPGPNDHTMNFYVHCGIPRSGAVEWNAAPEPDYLLATTMTAVGVGASAGIDIFCPDKGLPTATQQQRVKEVMDWMKSIDEYLPDCAPLSFAGIVPSEKTADFYGGLSLSRWHSSYQGAYKTMLDGQFCFDVLPAEVYLAGRRSIPKEIKALMLPNLVYMSREEIEFVREFVKNGGGLVATYMTSLGNEKEFGLADVFGVDYIGGREDDADFLDVPDEAGARRCQGLMKCTSTHEVVADAGHEGLCRLICSRLKVKIGKNALSHAFLVDPVLGTSVWPTEPKHLTEWPLVVTNTYGKGRVVYLPLKACAQYGTNGARWARLLLNQAIRWAAKESMPIRLQGPMCVEINAFRQHNPKRLLVHLVNFQSAPFRTMKPFMGTEAVPDYQTEYILPVNNLQLRLAKKLVKKPNKIYLAPHGRKLDFEESSEDWIINIPSLHIHGIVVIED